MRKLALLILIIFILIISYIIFLRIPKNYSYSYEVNGHQIKESFYKEKKYYTFVIKNKKSVYRYAIKHKYFLKRGLISKVKNYDNCVNFVFDEKNNTICLNNNEYTTSFYDKEIKSKQMDTYQKIKIYNLLDKSYYIWNYNDFLQINNKDYNKINIFNDDIYELKIITKIDNYLCLANYNEKYQFDIFYMINMKTGKTKEVKLNRRFYMDSIILGVYKNNIYLYDFKQEKEFKINLFKETVEENNYEILVNNKWKQVSINKLNKGTYLFSEEKDFAYLLKNNKLYYHMPNVDILVSSMKVSSIVESDEKNCYFISGDTLYHVDVNKKITKIMSYSEWQFNNQNIYVF